MLAESDELARETCCHRVCVSCRGRAADPPSLPSCVPSSSSSIFHMRVAAKGLSFFSIVLDHGNATKLASIDVDNGSSGGVQDRRYSLPAWLSRSASESPEGSTTGGSAAVPAQEPSPFSRFAEKKRQHAEKRTKTLRSIIRRSNTVKESTSSRDLQLSSLESNPATKELMDFLRDLKDAAACDVIKQVKAAMDRIHKMSRDQSVDELSNTVQDFYQKMHERFASHAHYQGASASPRKVGLQ